LHPRQSEPQPAGSAADPGSPTRLGYRPLGHHVAPSLGVTRTRRPGTARGDKVACSRWIAVTGLIGLILVVVVFAFVLEVGWAEKSLPDWITALATTALGAVVGVFAPAPVSRTEGSQRESQPATRTATTVLCP
jgi:hypothetical protein